MQNQIILTEDQLEHIKSLRKYLMTASQFPDLFQNIVGKNISYDMRDMISNPNFFPHGFSILCVWLGSLNCVVEGWFTLKLRDESIEKLIGTSGNQSDNTRKLNDFRHKVFHFQSEYEPLRMDFIYDPKLLEWAMQINFEFEKWFDYYFTANSLPRDNPHYEWFENHQRDN